MSKSKSFNSLDTNYTGYGSLPGFMSEVNRDISTIYSNESFLNKFKTLDDYNGFVNFQSSKILKDKLGITPYIEYGDYKSTFNPDAKNIDISNNDNNEVKAFKDIYNRIVDNKGKLPEPDFLRRSLSNNMTSGWIKFLTGKDFISQLGNFGIAKDGFTYNGEKLSLSSDESNFMQKFMQRINGDDIEKDSLDKFAELTVGLIADLPLMALTQGASVGLLSKLGTVGEGLLATKGIGRLLGNTAQQIVNFNILGIPQTVEAIKEDGIGAGLNQIMHNVWMGTLATATGEAGRVLFGNQHIPVINKIFENRPALREELSALGGSFGFGYLSGKLEGQENKDALAQGLAFAATHFTNPRSFRRVLTEQANKDIRISIAQDTEGKFKDTYFIEKDGQYHKINDDAFAASGRIEILKDVNPIPITEETKLPLYNEVRSTANRTFTDMMASARSRGKADELINRWKEEKPELYKANKDNLYMFAHLIGSSIKGEEARRIFSDWKLPEESKLDNMMIDFWDKYKIKYTDAKKYILNNLDKYVKDEDVFLDNLVKKLGLGEDIAKDLTNAMNTTVKLLVESEQAKLNKQLNQEGMERLKLQKALETYQQRQSDIEKNTTELKTQMPKRLTVNTSKRAIDILTQTINESEVGSPRRIAAEDLLKEEQARMKKAQTAKAKTPPAEEEAPKPIPTTEQKPISVGDLEAMKKLGYSDQQIQTISPKETKRILDKEIPAGEYTPVKETGSEVPPTTAPESGKKTAVPEGKGTSPTLNKEVKAPAKTREEYEKELGDLKKRLIDLNPHIPEDKVLRALGAKDVKEIDQRMRKGSRDIIDKWWKLNVEKHEKASVPTQEVSVEGDISDVATPENRINNLYKSATEDFNIQTDRKADPRFLTKVKVAAENSSGSVKEFARLMGVPKQLNFLWDIAEKLGIGFSLENSPDEIGLYREVYSGEGKIGLTEEQKNKLKPFSKKVVLGKDFWTTNNANAQMLRTGSAFKTDLSRLTSTLAHEVLHGAIKEAKANHPELIEKLKDLQTDIRKAWRRDRQLSMNEMPLHLKDRISYMIDNNHYEELVTIALTEAPFARYLNQIPASKDFVATTEGKTTLWNKMVDWVKTLYGEVLGLTKGSKLDEVVSALNEFGGTIKNNRISRAEIEKEASETNTENLTYKRSSGGYNYRVENENAIVNRYGRDMVEKIDRLHHDTREIGDKHVEKPKEVEDFSTLQTEMQREDSKQAKESDLVEVSGKSYKNMAKNDKVIKLLTGTRKYADLNVPPIFYADMSSKFRDRVYKDGEKMIRDIPYVMNTILHDKRGWNSGHDFNKLMFGKVMSSLGFGNAKVTAEGQHFLDAIRTYEYGRSNGKLTEDMGWEEFSDWAGFNNAQKKVLFQYRDALRDTISQMKNKKAEYIVRFDENPASHLNRSAVSRLLDKVVPKGELDQARKELNTKASTDEALKRKVANAVLDQAYRGWGEKFYYNGVRPASPKTWIVELTKPNDRISSYFDNKKEAQDFINEHKAKGWEQKELYQIKELIDAGSHWNKLNVHQLFELANAGHISLNNEIIQKLKEATKIGVDLHSVHKEYIKGMKYTAKEFESQLNRFMSEAIYGSFKGYHLTAIDRNLEEWQSELTPQIKGGKDYKQARLDRFEYEYGQRYFNQLKQREKTFVDPIRGAAIAFQVGGIKPAFIFQQASQIFQTTLSNSIAEIKDGGIGSVGDAIKIFNKSIGETIAYSFERARQKGNKDLVIPPGMGTLTPESMKLIEQLEAMNKIGGTGIRELTAEVGNLEYKYQDRPARRGWESVQKGLNFAGKAVEKMTRIQTALTYEKIGRAKGLEGRELLDFMADGIDKSLSEWGKGGRAPLLNSKSSNPESNTTLNALKKSFLTYKTFSFYNYGLWRSMIANRQYSALWSKATVGLGMHGITKFPLFASLLAIADLFSDDDMDYKMWQMSEDLDSVVPHAGEFLHRGLGSIAGFDLRETFGEDTPLISDLYAQSWADTWDGKLTEIALGAPFGFSKDIVNSSREFVNEIWDQVRGNTLKTDKDTEKLYRAVKRISPVFVRNIFNGMTLAEDGIEVRGKTLVTADDITDLDVISKVLSFPIAKQSRAYLEYDNGIEAQYNRAKQILRKGATHRKEFTEKLRKKGIKGEDLIIAVREEMKRVVKDMNEARKTIKELEPAVRQLRRKQRQGG